MHRLLERNEHMEDNNTALERFFIACDELIRGKHILAEKKIDELLRSVATSDDLMGLFSAVMENFNYSAAKRRYLIPPERSRNLRGEVYLPKDEAEFLAFVFCILTELENGSLKINDFLLRYFYEDGSLTASYDLFISRMIRPFRDIVRGCFPNVGTRDTGFLNRKREEGILDSLSQKTAAEYARLSELSLVREDYIAGTTILSEVSIAIDKKDIPEIKALLCGYLYFLQFLNIMNEESGELILLAGEL